MLKFTGRVSGRAVYRFFKTDAPKENITKRKSVPTKIGAYGSAFSATVAKNFPSGLISRTIGSLSEVTIPLFLRKPLFTAYISYFGVDRNELSEDLNTYDTFVNFFTRELPPGSRPIDENAQIVSPADGVILSRGIVNRKYPVIPQVKGSTFLLEEFIGPVGSRPSLNEVAQSKYKSRTGEEMSMYYCVIYLHPKNYHRFHSPSEWQPVYRRHFQGKLLPVRPSTIQKYPGLYCLNERLLYVGSWKEGFMAMAAVGAFGVGSIRVYKDSQVCTNFDGENNPGKVMTYDECPLKDFKFTKGEEFGEFRLGSTIVLFYEAPRGKYTWSANEGSTIRVGQPLFINKT